jgi:hypothetical protein
MWDNSLKIQPDLTFIDYFLKAFPIDPSQSPFRPTENRTYSFLDIEVTVSPERMLELYQKCHVVVFKELTQTETLLIGCGHRPIALDIIDPLPLDDPYPIQHQHPDVYTMDPNPLTNPDVCGFFGLHPIPEVLPTGRFHHIEIEGCNIFLDPDPMKYGLAEIARVIHPRTGTIKEVCITEDGTKRILNEFKIIH